MVTERARLRLSDSQELLARPDSPDPALRKPFGLTPRAFRMVCHEPDEATQTAVTVNAGRLDGQHLPILGCSITMPADPRAWQHQWLRVHLVIRDILGTRWDAKTWRIVKAELGQALELQSRLRRAASWH